MRFLEANARRIVVKIGTHSLTGPDGGLLTARIASICLQAARLADSGIEVILVSSGAIGLGMVQLGLARRPTELAGLQACAALGQPSLMEAWQHALKECGLAAAQILLTREDVRGRRRHLAVRTTLEKLLSYGAIPVVNENDTVSADEIRFGDNDVLAALVASLLKADLLVILSTIPGLMRDQGAGELIPVVEEITPEIEAAAGGPRDTRSTGGMVTKLEAARLATQSGCGMFIGNAAEEDILLKIREGSARGTFFVPQALSLAAKKRWIAFFERPRGALHLDAGAVEAIRERHSSLLPSGVRSVEGDFPEGAVVTLHNPAGTLVARGICAYSSVDLAGILGRESGEIRQRFPQRSRCEAVHRDRLVLM